MRHVRQQAAQFADAEQARRVVQRREWHDALDLGLDGVIDDRRVTQVRAAVHDAVADCDEVTQPGAAGVELAQHELEGRAVVGEVGGHLDGRLARNVVPQSRARLPDPLDESPRGDGAVGGIDQLVLQARRPGVDHQDVRHSGLTCCAWMAVMATVLMMSGTVQPRERSFTGRRSPWRTGPIATAAADR